MVNFDAPNREQSCMRRERSNTPLQALQLLNDVQHVEAARGLAQRLLSEAPADVASRINYLFKTVLSRNPTDAERELLVAQIAKHIERYQASPQDAQQLTQLGETKPPSAFAAQELAAYTLLASTVLNMDETLNRN
jgi:hypothetical protein